jgi:hypothetical protein
MQYIIPGIFLFASLIVFFAFFNLRLSIALYVSYLILVPYLQFNVLGVSLSYNLVNTILLLSFIYQWKKKKKHINYKIIAPFLILILFLFVLTFFEPDLPFDLQNNYLRLTAMQTCIVSLIIWNMAKDDIKTIEYLKWALIISISIACIYGLFLMNLGGLNPYTSFLSNYYNVADLAEVLGDFDSRLSFSSARNIQSTMTHPMRWALNLCFLTILFIVISVKEKSKLYWFLIVLMLYNLLVSGVRTGIVSMIIGAAYYFLFNINYKTLFFAAILLLSVNTIISVNEDLSNIFSSFTDIKGTKSDVEGSSIAMRLEQLHGCFKEIEGEELFGKGYGWTNYYQTVKGDHPVILAFESLIFVVLCNNGIVGIFVWGLFFVLLFKLHRKIIQLKKDIIFLDIFVLVYLSFAIGTGEYGYLPIFSVYYSVLFAYLVYYQRAETKRKVLI